jgi:hypothetical protein
MEVLMFRLLKLTAYALLGYAIYEFVVGLLQIEDENYRRSSSADSGRSSGQRRPEGAGMNITGPGEGQPVSTTGSSGETASHRVGRGVIAG